MAKAKTTTQKTTKTKDTVLVAYNSPRGIKLTTSKGEKVIINGSPVNVILGANGKPTRKRFGLTRIPAAVWEDLQRTYKGADWFTSNPPKMFAHEEEESVKDAAEDLKDDTHSFEQVDPEKQQAEEFTQDA